MKKVILGLFIFTTITTFASNPKEIKISVESEKQVVLCAKLNQTSQEEILPRALERNWSITCLGGGTVTHISVTGTSSDARAAADANCGGSWAIRGID